MKQVDKKKIIDAAFHIFVRDKIESAKMSEIAQAAGVGRATLFRHYPSKLIERIISSNYYSLIIFVCKCNYIE